MMGMVAVAGLALMTRTACSPSMPGIWWSMKMTSGRLWPRCSSACSADAAVSTRNPLPARIAPSACRAVRLSSTISAYLAKTISVPQGPSAAFTTPY